MNTIEIFILVLCISVSVVCCLGVLICLNNTLYCFVYKHEDWKLWGYYISRVDEFIWDGEEDKFVIPNTDIYARIWENELWENELCAIYWKGGCLCTFDEYHSKKMAKLLMTKVE